MNKNIPGAIIIEGHVQGLSNTRSLGEAGIPVYVVDKTNCIARYSKFCKKFFKCPDFIEDSFVVFLIDLAEKEDITGWALMPSNDHAVFTIAKYKQSLEKFYRIITPSNEIIGNIYDKLKLIQIAEERGIPVPKTYLASKYPAADSENFSPVLIKGRFGLSFYKTFKKKVFLARNEDELKNILTSISGLINNDNILIQELIPSDGSNKTVSFTAFSVNGDIKSYWMGVKVREHPLEFGTATFARSVYIRECYEQSIPLLKAMNYSGVCEVEYLLDPRDKRYKLIEINARTWLWVGLARAAGVDFARIAYNYLNNLANEYNENYNLDIKWSNIITDSFFSIISIFSGKLTLKEFIKSYKGKVVHAVFDKSDIKPFLIYIVFLFRFLKNR